MADLARFSCLPTVADPTAFGHAGALVVPPLV